MTWVITPDLYELGFPEPDKKPSWQGFLPPAPSRDWSRKIYPDDWWDDANFLSIQKTERYAEEIARIRLPDPPDATGTRAELDDILAHPSAADYQIRLSEIVEENEGPPAYYRRMLLIDRKRRSQTGAILPAIIHWSHPFIFHFKRKWKRPRPMQLEPRIRPAVDCPLHPAYPSGHSTQAHMIALVLGAVTGRADVKDALWDAADRIAENREYAGLHYRSDSDCGAKLAQELTPLFLAAHAPLIEKAREEWG